MPSQTQHNETLLIRSKCRSYLQSKNDIRLASRQNSKNNDHFLASRFTLNCLCAGTILLVLFDWVFTLKLMVFPVSLYLRAFLLVVFSVYLFKTGAQWKKFKFTFGNLLLFFAIINIIYSFTSSDLIGNLFFSARIIFWLMGTVVAYRLFLSGIFSETIFHTTIVTTIFLAATFTIYLMTRSFGTGNHQNASAYLLLWCLPLLLMQKKSRLGNLVFALAVFAILMSIKRGAMIALVLSLLAYVSTYLVLFGNFRRYIRIIFIATIVTMLGAYAVLSNWDTVQTRFQDTSGSGRDRLYTMVFKHWINSEPTELVFGFGLQSVQAYTAYIYYGPMTAKRGINAHSDWLQCIHDFGLLGLSFMLWLHLKVIALIRISYRRRLPCTPSLVMAYVILFLVNIYSGFLGRPDAIYFGLLIAYSTAAILPQQKAEKKSFGK